MSEEIDLEDLARRLVISRKRDGRSVYDPVAKRELIEACMQPGVSVTKVARACGVNANQLSTWIRVQQRTSVAAPQGQLMQAPTTAFVPVTIERAPAPPPEPALDLTVWPRQ